MTDNSPEEQLAAADQETEDIRVRMETIHQEVAGEVESAWTSAFKSEDTVDAKVRARLSGHQEYQALRARRRELEELRRSLTSQLDGLSGETPH
jgi:hypothetical protein